MKKNQLNNKIRRPRLLIVGCGDVGLRILPLLSTRYRIFALTTRPERRAELRLAGAIPLIADLDQPATLARLAQLADRIVYLAPPASGTDTSTDQRSRRLATVLAQRCTMVYVSTSGVYGDCGGALISETRPPRPHNARALRRVAAEKIWRSWARRTGSRLSILRVPGIYAANRLPIDRLKHGTPALLREQDVFTNHIHADDLARLIVQTLWHGSPNRIYHAVDDTQLLMGDYFDAVADRFDLPRPPRLPRAELEQQVSPMLLSFMSESRRMSNTRAKSELGWRLRFPTVADGLA